MSILYSDILRKWIFPYSYRIRKIDFINTMKQALDNQSLTHEEIISVQFKKLSSLLDHAYNTVPFYREKFDSIGLKPEDIQSWEDFMQVPVLSKDQIQRNPELFLSSNPRTGAASISTSGSTGSPLKFHLSKASIASDLASHYRSLKWWGIELGDRYIMWWGYGYDPFKATTFNKALKSLFVKPVEDRIMNRRTLPAFNITESSMDGALDLIRRFKPKYIFTYPSALSLFADHIKNIKFDGRLFGIQAVVSFGEVLFDWQTDLFQDVFGCRTINTYGSAEVGIIGFSLPCGCIHTMDDFIITEVLKENPADEFGEVVVTPLENYASPLIRYNLEDLAIPGEESHECPLGIGFSTLKQIIGRHHDKIQLSYGTYVHGTVFTALMHKIEHVNHFQVIQKEPDCFEVMVVTDSGEVMPEVERNVISGFRKRAGIKYTRVIRVPEIPTEAGGKFRFVRSEIN